MTYLRDLYYHGWAKTLNLVASSPGALESEVYLTEKTTSAPAYRAAGVDLEQDESFVDEVKDIARGTFRAEVLSSIGGFAGLFKAPEKYSEPVFVAGTDGVGTKLKIAAQQSRFDTVGIDCVAMVVNDLIVQGAEPLVFLDYLAMGEHKQELTKQALSGIAEGCRRAGCALLGGETATMPGVYADGELEIVGFGVGVVERARVIDGTSVRSGDTLIGLASSGLHSNGFSLVRSIVDRGITAGQFELKTVLPELNTTLAAALLTPTRIYVKPVLNILRDFDIHGLSHITGGGFPGNIPRVLPKGLSARVAIDSWTRPPIFDFLAKTGNISNEEMLRVFNCGIGMVLVVAEEDAEDIILRLNGMSERAYEIGKIEQRGADDPPLVLEG